MAAFRALELQADSQKDAAGLARLSVIEEGQVEGRQSQRPEGGALASLGEALQAAGSESSTEEGTQVASGRPQSPCDRCHGFLEWTLQGEEEKSNPQWAGPSLFQVDRSSSGRWVFRLSTWFSTQAEELSIPLLAVSSVREYKQDALGMIFFVRYKASGGARVQVLFRAANSESRTAWVSDICEAIRQARSEASGR